MLALDNLCDDLPFNASDCIYCTGSLIIRLADMPKDRIIFDICFSLIAFISYLDHPVFFGFWKRANSRRHGPNQEEKTALRQGDGPLADNTCKCTLSTPQSGLSGNGQFKKQTIFANQKLNINVFVKLNRSQQVSIPVHQHATGSILQYQIHQL